jgi:phosphate transport system permease protein
MTATATRPEPQATPTGHRSIYDKQGNAGRRALVDRITSLLLLAAMVIAIVPLLLILFVVVREGVGVIRVQFLSEPEITYRGAGQGYAQGFVGTAYIMLLAVAMAIPLGIAAAVYLVEYGRGRLATLVRFFTDVMTGVPSVFVGLFIFAILVVGPGGLRFGTFVGAVAIAVMMLPIVVRSSEEMLKLVPQSLRNASYGLGARKWQTVTKVVLPAAGPGIATGSMLAVARGAGETAPLLLTALGSLTVVTTFQGTAQSSLTLLIYRGATQPFDAGIERAWGGALSLLVLTLLFTVAARLIGSRLTKKGLT